MLAKIAQHRRQAAMGLLHSPRVTATQTRGCVHQCSVQCYSLPKPLSLPLPLSLSLLLNPCPSLSLHMSYEPPAAPTTPAAAGGRSMGSEGDLDHLELKELSSICL